MATRTSVTLEDDLEGRPADETVRFALGGAEYEIDLSRKNDRVFRKQLAPFAEHARRAGPGSAGRRGRAGARARRRHPGMGEGPRHRGQRSRPDPRQRGRAVPGRHARTVIRPGSRPLRRPSPCDHPGPGKPRAWAAAWLAANASDRASAGAVRALIERFRRAPAELTHTPDHSV